MKKKDYRTHDYLLHILAGIDNIEKYTEKLTETEFLQNSLVKDAVLYNFTVIGEASNNIRAVDPDFLASHQELKKILKLAYDMRNLVIHAYLDVDYLTIWDTIQNSSPPLKSLVLQAKASKRREPEKLIKRT